MNEGPLAIGDFRRENKELTLKRRYNKRTEGGLHGFS